MNTKLLKKLLGDNKGAALVEYGMIIAGVALIAAGAVSIFGTKTSDLVASIATVLPGAHSTDNAPIVSGKLIETTDGSGSDPISLDINRIQNNSATERLGDNLLGTNHNATSGITTLVKQANP